jgi:hypothetical protein
MKKVTLLACAMYLGIVTVGAQNSCNDVNGYPQSKNTGGTGAYTLTYGQEEYAAQAYNYKGPGKISGVRIYGYSPNVITGVHMMVKVYNVDASNRPTSIIGSKSTTWDWLDNVNGHKDVSFFGGGYALSSNFAVSVEIVNGITSVTQFQVTYNGNGEGRGEDLASLAGTSTGFNWASAKTTFNKDGDFYIIPKMKNYNTADFSPATTCASTNSSIAFTNDSKFTTDSMFNKITQAHYAGTNHLYTWDFGDGSATSYAMSPAHTYTAAGVYTVTLTSFIEDWNSGCSNTITKRISVGLTAGTPGVTDATCNGAKNGSFTVTPTGGATPYTYSIDGETYGSGSAFNTLYAGTYTVHVKDAVGCDQTAVALVAEPAPILFSLPTTTNASCSNSDGAIQISASGGSGALQYSLNSTTWQGNGTFNNLSAGTYTVYAKDGNGCTKTTFVAVNNLGGPSLSVVSSTNVNCYGASNAIISLSATGGSGLLLYSINGTTFQSSGSFTGLAAGTYYATVKDASGCLDIKQVIVSQPSQLNFTPTSTAVLCNSGSDGHIAINNVTGGTGTMIYSIDGINFQSGNTFSGVSAGVYATYVRDASGCLTTHTVSVMEPSILTAIATVGNATCNKSANGDINVVASGGTAGYSYSLDGVNFFPAGDFSELTAGTYTITVKDANGCTISINSSVTQPSVLTSTTVVGNATCGNADGNILITGGGGSGSGYQYSINGTTFNSTGSFTNLPDSTYNILVRDGSGCEAVFQAIVINSNGPVINSISSTNVSCYGGFNGSITVTNVTGGTGTLYYSVNGSPWQLSNNFAGISAGVNTVLVQDGLGCTGSYTTVITSPAAIVVNVSATDLLCSGNPTGSATVTAGGGSGVMAYSTDGITYQSGNVFNNLSAGNYQVFVRDAGSCVASNNFTITTPAPIVINVGILNVTCSGSANGGIAINANGGTGSLQYSLDGLTYQPGKHFAGLSGGVYTIYVKDANGCVKTQTASIYEPTAIVTSSNVSNVSCYGGHNGSISVNASGGTGGFVYTWSNNATGPVASNLYPGSYSLTVTDNNGCTKTLSDVVTQPSSPLVINATITNATSGTSADGALVATVTGGTSPYTYSWSNGPTTPYNDNLLPGTYIATVTDANGCVTSGVFTVGSSAGIQSLASGSTQVKIYPNPADAFVTLESNDATIDQVEVLNLVGEVVYKDSPKTIKVNINVSGFTEGMYFVRYQVNNKYVTKRIEVLKP